MCINEHTSHINVCVRAHAHLTVHNSTIVVKSRASEVRTPAFNPGFKIYEEHGLGK